MESAGGIIMVNTSLAINDQTEDSLNVIINDSPLKWCSVSLSDVVNSGKRLEASVYNSLATIAKNQIKKCPFGYSTLNSESWLIDKAYHAPRFKRNYVSKSHRDAVGFLGSAEMLDVKPSPRKYISKELANKLNLHIKPNMVLLSCSGTIGNISFGSKSIVPYAISQHVIKLECKENAGFVYACLKNHYVKEQINALIYGSVIEEIEPEHLEKVIVPCAPAKLRNRINNLIVESYNLRDESNDLIDEATALLIEELKLPNIDDFDVDDYKKNAPVETFSVKLSDMTGRADASYHLPIVDAIVEHFKQNSEEVTTIGDERISQKIVLAGVFKRTYVEEEYGYPFLGGKEITQLSPKTEKFLSKAIHKKRYEKELKVNENMVLVTDRGTIGIAAFVPKHWDGYAVSQNVLKIVPANNLIAGYLFIYLNSEYCKLLVRRQTYGSVVDMIDNHSLESVEIPLLKSDDVQKQINDLALLANQKRYEAYCLEQEALRIMDEEVIFAKQGRT